MTQLTKIAVGMNTFCTIQKLVVSELPALKEITIPCDLKRMVASDVNQCPMFDTWMGEREKRREEEEKRRNEMIRTEVNRCVERMITRIEQNDREERGIVSMTEDLEKLPKTQTIITVIRCADYNQTSLDFSKFTKLEQLVIGDNCFNNVVEFTLKGFLSLQSVQIGKNSFYNRSGEVTIAECPMLVSICIENGSFKNFSSFAASSLPALEEIHIGKNCFTSSNFSVEDMKKLKRIEIEEHSFELTDNIRIKSCKAHW